MALDGYPRNFAVCRCFYDRNIFVREWSRHVTFRNEKQFLADYGDFATATYPDERDRAQALRDAMAQCRQEVDRRRRVRDGASDRRKLFRESYTPLHPEIYQFSSEFLHPDFPQDDPAGVAAVLRLGRGGSPAAYTLPVFKESFCRKLREELKHFEACGIHHEQPNSMNRHGVILDEIGLSGFFDAFRTLHLQKLSQRLFPEVMAGNVLDSHKAFSVKYKVGEDEELAAHFDNSEVTLNFSISDDHEGGELIFHDGGSSSHFGWAHRCGHGLLHLGCHVHQALPITSGERWNCIVWMRSSRIRNRRCPMCKESPEKVPAPFYGDGFTLE